MRILFRSEINRNMNEIKHLSLECYSTILNIVKQIQYENNVVSVYVDGGGMLDLVAKRESLLGF